MTTPHSDLPAQQPTTPGRQRGTLSSLQERHTQEAQAQAAVEILDLLTEAENAGSPPIMSVDVRWESELDFHKNDYLELNRLSLLGANEAMIIFSCMEAELGGEALLLTAEAQETLLDSVGGSTIGEYEDVIRALSGGKEEDGSWTREKLRALATAAQTTT